MPCVHAFPREPSVSVRRCRHGALRPVPQPAPGSVALSVSPQDPVSTEPAREARVLGRPLWLTEPCRGWCTLSLAILPHQTRLHRDLGRWATLGPRRTSLLWQRLDQCVQPPPPSIPPPGGPRGTRVGVAAGTLRPPGPLAAAPGSYRSPCAGGSLSGRRCPSARPQAPPALDISLSDEPGATRWAPRANVAQPQPSAC